jgi:hypothetical protein
MVALHGRLHTGVLKEHLSAVHQYLPHVTLGRIPDAEQRATSLANIRRESPSIEALLGEVAVFDIAKGTAEFTHRLSASNALRGL